MPTCRASWLPLAAVVANGLLVGASLDQSIKQLPARHRIGVTAFPADLVLQPGVVAGLVPWWLTGWQVRHPAPSWAWTPLRVAGVALLAAGLLVLVEAFVRFVVEGVGTPAPIAPTQRLVVGGPYRYVRNPMYLAVVAAIVGQALLLGQPGLLALRRGRRRRHGRLRPRPQGADPAPTVRRPVPGLPAGRACLVATPPPLATRPRKPLAGHEP